MGFCFKGSISKQNLSLAGRVSFLRSLKILAGLPILLGSPRLSVVWGRLFVPFRLAGFGIFFYGVRWEARREGLAALLCCVS